MYVGSNCTCCYYCSSDIIATLIVSNTTQYIVFVCCCSLFGTTGYCSACSKMIPSFEMVMRAKDNVYHLECFACQQCSHR